MTVAIRTVCVAGLWTAIVLALAGCAGAPEGDQPASSVEYLSQSQAMAMGCPAGANVIVGTAGNDVLGGTSKRDCMLGLAGDDRLEGGNGDDVLIGGAGNDDLYGGNGNDSLRGEAGDDVMVGGNGDDEMLGGDGNDVAEGGNGNDKAEGGLCHDMITGDNGDDVLSGNGGADRIEDGRGNDKVNGGDGPDACDGVSCELHQCGGSNCDSDSDCASGMRCVMATGLCASPSQVVFEDLSCDGQDSDCDGNVDEDYVPTATSCGVGACASVGEMLCAGGQGFDSCEPGEPAADDSSCNGVDDDCDGNVDEDFVSEATSCGEGECAGAGETSCVAGAVVDSCQASEGTDDGNPCTLDTCDPVEGDMHTALPVGTSCSDGDECNGEETCQGGSSPFIAIDPRATYLRTNLDSPVLPSATSLASLGLSAGDVVTISVVGAMKNSPSDTGTTVAMGIFSNGATVLTMTNRVNRVPGALLSDAPGYVTPNTQMGNLATDIPQDFRFDQNGVTVTIPAGATHLITGALSNFFGDNTNLAGSPFGFVISTGEIACTAGEPPAVCE